MGADSKIEWTTHTLLPEQFAALELSDVSGAVRFVMANLMARVTERDAIFHSEGQVWKLSHFLDVVSAEIPAIVVAAILTDVPVSLEYRGTPNLIFRHATQTERALKFAMAKCVVRFAARRAFLRYRTYPGASLHCVPLSEPVRRARLRCLTHFAPRVGAHLGALAHG
jgi:hypothetical protein